jgi:cellulose synthase operon protein C
VSESDFHQPNRETRVRSQGLIVAVTAALALNLFMAPEASFAQERAKKPAAPQKGAQPQRAVRSSGGDGTLELSRSRQALPESSALKQEVKPKQLSAVKPPRSGDFYEGDTKEAEYERILDEEIKALYKLSQQTRKSANRGEIWLRLGERYVEKARLVEMRAQADYDRQLKDFHDKKSRMKPNLDLKLAHEYNTKAVQLYEWFVKDFPQDPKVDQALFFLGYNHFELSNTKLGEKYYQDLLQRFPKSIFVSESRFALGEYYFEKEDWRQALENYAKVIEAKNPRLNTFALYKSSWCLYRLNRVPAALQTLERVVRLSRAADAGAQGSGRRTVNKVRLANEALKDYVPFYAEAKDPKDAVKDFARLTRDEKQTLQMLERLAFIYADSGNRGAATFLFKRLISMNPGGERSAEYQYQVVLSHATLDQKEFRKELEVWLEAFGENSFWARENSKKPTLVADAVKLQETTLRNHVLQNHQTAQNSRAEYSQRMAISAYGLYFKYFSNSPKAPEMQFFYAEILFDMKRYEEAARIYGFVADSDPKGPYREKAIINALLALEKDLPTAQEIEKKRGNALDKIPLDPPVQRFEKAALRYIDAFPKGEKTPDIQRRLGVLYYNYNHFDEAIPLFEKLVREHPKTQNGEIAGNLILDIYKLKDDMIGLADKGKEFLANPNIANSKFGEQVRGIMEKASYMRAEKLAELGDHGKAAQEFEAFAGMNKQTDLAAAARFKAALSYEKVGDFGSSIRMYNMVLAAKSGDPKIKSAQNDARNALARVYQQTGLLEMAARQYHSYAAANPNDPKAINAFYNAGVIWDGLGEVNEAMRSYEAYLAASKRADRLEVIFAQAEMHKRKEQWTKASALYDKFLKSGSPNQAKAILATYEIGQIHNRMGRTGPARQQYQKVVEIHKRSGKQAREETARAAAHSRFELAQETIAKLSAIRFGTNDKTQGRAAADVKFLREKYINEMKDVIRYDNAEYIVAALASTGQMFDLIADLFAKIPVPAGFSAEDAAKYRELIQVQINGVNAEAKNSYKAAVDKSQELESYGNWTRVALSGLATHDPANSGFAGELVIEAKAADWMGM